MKNTAPKTLVFIISFLFSIIGISAVHFFLGDTNPIQSGDILWLFFVFFIFSYAILFLILQFFLFKKMEVLYKNIFSNYQFKRSNVMSSDNFKEMEEEVSGWLEEKKDELNKLKIKENFQKEFIGNIAHELKTPLFTIQGYILTLLEGGLEDPRINRTYLQKAEQSVERMSQLLDDLDLLTKLEANQIQLKKQKVDLKELIDSCIEELKINISGTEKNIVNNIPKNIWVNIDRKRIYQVFINLLNNSIKYCYEKCAIEISYTLLNDKVIVEFSDNGPGISKEHLIRIFERFYRVEESRSRNSGGSGLGLSIVKSILDAHNESINVTSKVGEGTRFTFTLERWGV